MSEQQPQPTSAETGSVSAASDARTEFNSQPVMAESPTICPDQELTSPGDTPRVEPDVEKIEPRIEAAKAEAPKIDLQAEKKAEAPRPSGNVLIMAPGERAWAGEAEVSKPAASMRRVAAMVAIVGLAAVAGAIGGALATSDLRNGKPADTAAVRDVGFEAAVARIDAEILALKASVEQNAKLGVSQFNKTSDRLDKVEKVQAEPTAKLARLSEEVSRLRTAQAAAPAAPAAAAAPVQLATAAPAPTSVPKDVTGSVTPPATTAAATPAAPAAPPKTEVGRLPTVEGWVLREVGRGSALIESRRGLFEVFAGDPIPGVGRVDAIRKQDGRWVVVTSKGLIVSR
ncbi:MAG: hypothetical protein ACRC1G_01255 [Bradyrhizobium sp.]|nr:hypothetical protein [Bradyrhizobium sp.]